MKIVNIDWANNLMKNMISPQNNQRDIVFETDQTKAITLLTSVFGDKTAKYDESFHSLGTDLHKSMFDSCRGRIAVCWNS